MKTAGTIYNSKTSITVLTHTTTASNESISFARTYTVNHTEKSSNKVTIPITRLSSPFYPHLSMSSSVNSARETPYSDISTMESMTVGSITAEIKTTVFTSTTTSNMTANIITDYSTMIDGSASYTSIITTTNMMAPTFTHVPTTTITPKQTLLSSIQTTNDKTVHTSAPFHVETTAGISSSFHAVKITAGISSSFHPVETTVVTSASFHRVETTTGISSFFHTVETTVVTFATFHTVETKAGPTSSLHTISLFTPETIVLTSVTASFSKSYPLTSTLQYKVIPFLSEATLTTTVPNSDSTIPKSEMRILFL